ncbi:MAG: hypothetical protein JSR39_00190 [Verrucomicrobia bacterium]|nr:hypothetical protein [Verrucomicrobiota bacterium]
MLRGVFFVFAAATCAVFHSGAGLIADDQIMLPNTNANITSPTPVQAIVLDSNGNMSEEEYMYNPDTQVVVVDSNNGGDNASIFFPLFAAGFIWWDGYWVNHEGNYYVNNHWVHVNNPDWNNHWHDYWNNHWDNHWHNYWNQHRNDPNFRYGNQEHWQEHNFRGGQRGGGDFHRGGGGRGHGGGRR